MNKISIYLIAALFIFFASCKDKEEVLDIPTLNTWYPNVTGKYLIYRVDSTLYVNFGSVKVERTSYAKDEFAAEVTDNLGRPSTRITRSYKEKLTDAWTPVNTFFVTHINGGNTVEYIENNLRYIRLVNPVNEETTWRGNSYIIENLANPFQYNLEYLRNWNYVYKNINKSYTVNNTIFPETITVEQANTVTGDTSNPAAPSEVNRSYEVFAKGVGLVYKDFYHGEFQPASSGSAAGFKANSYGIKLTLIDKN
jgi:hypothetical protein